VICVFRTKNRRHLTEIGENMENEVPVIFPNRLPFKNIYTWWKIYEWLKTTKMQNERLKKFDIARYILPIVKMIHLSSTCMH
jgi:hypothetical protein